MYTQGKFHPSVNQEDDKEKEKEEEKETMGQEGRNDDKGLEELPQGKGDTQKKMENQKQLLSTTNGTDRNQIITDPITTPRLSSSTSSGGFRVLSFSSYYPQHGGDGEEEGINDQRHDRSFLNRFRYKKQTQVVDDVTHPLYMNPSSCTRLLAPLPPSSSSSSSPPSTGRLPLLSFSSFWPSAAVSSDLPSSSSPLPVRSPFSSDSSDSSSHSLLSGGSSPSSFPPLSSEPFQKGGSLDLSSGPMLRVGRTDFGFGIAFILAILVYLVVICKECYTGQPARLYKGIDHRGRVCGVDVKGFALLYWPAIVPPKKSTHQELPASQVLGVCTDVCPSAFASAHQRKGRCPPDDADYCSWYSSSPSVRVSSAYCLHMPTSSSPNHHIFDNWRRHVGDVGVIWRVAMWTPLLACIAGALYFYSIQKLQSAITIWTSVITIILLLISIGSIYRNILTVGDVPSAASLVAVKHQYGNTNSTDTIKKIVTRHHRSTNTVDVESLRVLSFSTMSTSIVTSIATMTNSYNMYPVRRLVSNVSNVNRSSADSKVGFNNSSVGWLPTIVSSSPSSSPSPLSSFSSSSLSPLVSSFTRGGAGRWVAIICWLAAALGLALAVIYRRDISICGRLLKACSFFVRERMSVLGVSVFLSICTAAIGCVSLYALLATLSNTSSCAHESAFHPCLSLPVSRMVSILFQLVMGVWICNFLSALNQLIISLVVGDWYFASNYSPWRAIGRATSTHTDHTQQLLDRGGDRVLAASGAAVRLHSGTAALGALVLTATGCIKFFLQWIPQHPCLSASRVFPCRFFPALSFGLRSLYSSLCFLSPVAYVHTALTGLPFCAAARCAFKLGKRNPVKYALVRRLGIRLHLIGILVVALAATAAAMAMATHFYSLSSVLLPGFCVFGLALVAGRVVVHTWSIAADAILQCYLVDEEMARMDGKAMPEHAPYLLREFWLEQTPQTRSDHFRFGSV